VQSFEPKSDSYPVDPLVGNNVAIQTQTNDVDRQNNNNAFFNQSSTAKNDGNSSVSLVATEVVAKPESVVAVTLATILALYQKQSTTTAADYNAVSNAIKASPALQNALNTEIADNVLGSITSSGNPALGGFSASITSNGTVAQPGTMDIGPSYLQNIISNPYQVIDFLAHETQHAVDADPNSTLPGAGINSEAWGQYETGVSNYFNNGTGNLTSLIQSLVPANLQDEGLASIAGYNAAVQAWTLANNGAVPTQSQMQQVSLLGYMAQQVAGCQFNADGTIDINVSDPNTGAIAQQNVNVVASYFAAANPSGSGDPSVSYVQKDVAQALNFAFANSNGASSIPIDYSALSDSQFSINTSSNASGLVGPNTTGLSDLQIDELLEDGGFNCGGQSQCAVVDTSTNTTNYFNIGVASSQGSTTNTVVTTQPLSSSSSSSETVNGSTILVTANDENVNASADSGDGLNISGSQNNVISAPGVLTSLDGNSNTDQLGNGSTALTAVGDTNNTITCGNSSANINGESLETCSISQGGNGQLTVDGSNLTGTLQGDVTLTESGDTFTADSNANVTMASGDYINVAAGTSNVELTCGTGLDGSVNSETVSNDGTSGSASIQCTINDQGVGTFIPDGGDLILGMDTGNTTVIDNSGDTVNMQAGATLIDNSATGGDTINAVTGDTIQISNDGGSSYQDTINASDDTGITLESGSSLDLIGGGDTVGANTGDQITASSGDTINAANNASLTITDSGTADIVDGNTLSVMSNSSALTFDGTGDTLYGTKDTDELGDGSSVTETAGGNTLNMDAGSTLDDTTGTGGDTINAGTDGTIQVSNDGGSTYYDTINATDDTGTITLTQGSSADVDGSGNTIAAKGGGDLTASGDAISDAGTTTESIAGGDNTITAGGAALSLSGAGVNNGDTVDGNDVSMTSSSSYVTLTGTGDTFSGSGNTLDMDTGSAATLNGGSDTVGMQTGASLTDSYAYGGDTIDAGSGDTIQVSNNGGGYSDTIDASNDANITLGSGSNLDLVGGDDTLTGTGSGTVSVDGQGNVIDISNATIDLTSGDAVTITGSNDKIYGGSDDTFSVTGTDDDVSATYSAVSFSGTNTGDDVTGTDDTGAGWAAPDPDDSGDEGGYGGYSGGGDDGGGYGYGLTKWKKKDPSATEVAKAEQSDSVYEGAKWADKTITWSFATAGGDISDAVTNTKEQQEIEAAFQAWAKASGLTFVELAPGAKSNIEVGFSDLNTASTNQIGLTTYSSQGGTLSSAQVELEDPNQVSLTTNASGQLAYANTGATFEQVTLHEIGHALGLADTDIAGSIMNGVLGAGNEALSATDKADIQGLYNNPGATHSALAQANQLVQAMSVFDATDGVAVDGLPSATNDALLYSEHTLTSSYVKTHIA
jgi:predicted Zn-dependent protease